MTFIRKHGVKRAQSFRPETIAFISEDFDSPNYPKGIVLFWHRFSLASGHRGGHGYSVPYACAALGVDVEAVRQRHDIPPRYKGDPGWRDRVSRGGSVDFPVSD
jgi:hypothetical protein